MDQRSKQIFHKKNLQISNMHMKKRATSYIIRKLQIKQDTNTDLLGLLDD